ncbi:MAG: glutathione S-transferase family protein [Alphaproteobacteria bacterium]|nr:glutathione S-transferase family protein [Alphaproteobacteria bacterium]
MKLYYCETSNPRKACAVAKHLGSPVEYVRVDLQSGAHKQPGYLAINPNGKVPTLVDGDFRLWESNAIMCYLAAKAGSDLWPGDERQIDIIRWFNWDTAHFSRHASTFVFQNVIKPTFGLGEPDPSAVAEATEFFIHFAGVLNGHLEGRDYLVGDALSVADFAVASTLPSADRAGLPLAGFPEIRRWHEALEALPAWRDPFPKNLAKSA